MRINIHVDANIILCILQICNMFRTILRKISLHRSVHNELLKAHLLIFNQNSYINSKLKDFVVF